MNEIVEEGEERLRRLIAISTNHLLIWGGGERGVFLHHPLQHMILYSNS
jgi:hypothetical protein